MKPEVDDALRSGYIDARRPGAGPLPYGGNVFTGPWLERLPDEATGLTCWR
ncbi:hypothetical protein KAU45_08620 [bacterium]|nr:hypothetical protein [bacterium]